VLSAESQVQTRSTLSTVLTHFSATIFVDCSGVYGDGCDANGQNIYQANKAVIGDNPNVLRPGQVLSIPEATCNFDN